MTSEQKDHFVSQTYLRAFAESDELWVYNKKWSGAKKRSPAAICKEEGGSTNPYLSQERVIEEYLKPIENGWSDAVQTFSKETLDLDEYFNAKALIASYIAYLRFNTPAVVSAGRDMLAGQLKAQLLKMKKAGLIPAPPRGYEFLLDDLENQVQVEVDRKYPQALGIQSIPDTQKTIFTAPWMRLSNNTKTPFLTSDNPACTLEIGSGIPTVYLPLSPQLALLVRPFRSKDDAQKYDHIEDKFAEAKPEFIEELNNLVIKSADRHVLSNIKSDLFLEQIKAHKDWKFGCELTLKL